MDVISQLYADDSQFLFDFNVYDSQKGNRVMNEVQSTSNLLSLKLNPEKSEAILFPCRNFFVKSVFNLNIALKDSVKLLEFALDKKLTFEKQVNKVCQHSCLQIRKLYCIKKS